MGRFFPFQALGFRRNPFSTLTPDEWAEVAVLPAALETGFDHLQCLGPKGCGKTTCLHALARRFEAAGTRVAYERIFQNKRRFQTDLSTLDCFLLDEAQQLGWRARRRLLHAAAGGLRVVLATHADFSAHFTRRGLPLATFDVVATITPAHVGAVLARRLAYFALEVPPPVRLAPDVPGYLFVRFGSDLRSMERLLYEVFQHLEAPGVLTARDLARQHPGS